MAKQNSNISTWTSFIAVLFILVGLYGTFRTLTNLMFFDKYPQSGVLNLNFSGIPYYPQKESDCNYPVDYQNPEMTDEQKTQQREMDQKNCIQGIVDVRESAKANDISQSALFLFLGVGLLAAKRILKF